MLYRDGNGFEGLALPLTTLLLGGVVISSALLAGVQRRIYWRGTFYPLAKLREGVRVGLARRQRERVGVIACYRFGLVSTGNPNRR